MKKPVKKKRTGWHPASEPPKDAFLRIVCNCKLGWFTRGCYDGKQWLTDDWNPACITHWHDYPKLPKEEE